MSPEATTPPAPLPDSEFRETERARRFERVALEAPLTLSLEAQSLSGTADNVSRVGLMLFTDEPLRVSVRIDGFQDGRAIHGRLVRLQRLDDATTGIAIEFDDLVDPRAGR